MVAVAVAPVTPGGDVPRADLEAARERIESLERYSRLPLTDLLKVVLTRNELQFGNDAVLDPDEVAAAPAIS